MFKRFDSMVKKWSKGEKIVAAVFIPIILYLVFYFLCYSLVGRLDRDEMQAYLIITTLLSFIVEMRIFKHFNNNNSKNL